MRIYGYLRRYRRVFVMILAHFAIIFILSLFISIWMGALPVVYIITNSLTLAFLELCVSLCLYWLCQFFIPGISMIAWIAWSIVVAVVFTSLFVVVANIALMI
ncbi:MAG: hypothetical protein JNL67_16695 [Planctomycetaceae bacterium]|nr:hypothetical protein [Planctomycetaceae bacterium]